MDIYIYYRVPCSAAAQLQARVSAMQAGLTRHHPVRAALKRRTEQKDDMDTWMEVYLAVTDGFMPALQQAIAEAGLSDLIIGERHTEHFLEVSSCA